MSQSNIEAKPSVSDCNEDGLNYCLRRAVHSAEGTVDCLHQVKLVFYRRRWFMGVYCAFIGVFLSVLITGAASLNDCPAEPMVEVWMVVTGAVGTLSLFLGLFESSRYLKRQTPDGRASPVMAFVNLISSLFLFAWQVAGTIWVVSAWKPGSDKSAADYCNGNYYYAFGMIIALYIFLLLFLLYSIYIAFVGVPE